MRNGGLGQTKNVRMLLQIYAVSGQSSASDKLVNLQVRKPSFKIVQSESVPLSQAAIEKVPCAES